MSSPFAMLAKLVPSLLRRSTSGVGWRSAAAFSSSFPPASREFPPHKFPFPLKPENLFEERKAQFINWGIPKDKVDKVEAQIKDMWDEGPAGWVYEWSQLAQDFVDEGNHGVAAYCYGAAKFPVIATPARQIALANQVEQYAKASPNFPVKFDRKILTCYHKGKAVDVPVHVLSHPEADASRPVMIGSGGVDTWKMDLHGIWQAFALACKCHVVAFDLPGNGELCHLPMDDTGDEVIHGIISFARHFGNGTTCHFGFSMGGHYSALSGLRHDTDLAIVCGGPTNDSFTPENAKRLTAGFGMDGIMFNSIGRWSKMPGDIQTLINVVPIFNLKYLIADDMHCPMFVINGETDYHISNKDVLEFKGRRDTEVHLFPKTGHCCDAHPDAIKMMVAWLKGRWNP